MPQVIKPGINYHCVERTIAFRCLRMKKISNTWCLIVWVSLCTGAYSSEKPEPPAKPLVEAAFSGDLETVRLHIAAQSDLKLTDPEGATPLMVATTFGHDEIVQELIQAGVGINQQKNDGATALHVAALLGQTSIVEQLLKAGADKNIQNTQGHTAMDGVTAPFESVKPIYDLLNFILRPMGLQLDYIKIQQERPVIAEMLRSN